jgi:DNA-binding NarL/FixJ family response regulator
MIKIVIADDQQVVRHGLSSLLAFQKDLQVVGEAAHGEEACAMVRDFHPDVVLMDIRMPICDGIAATKRILEENKAVRVIVLTTFDEDDLISKALAAGAAGYLLKDTPSEQIASAIRTVYDGNTLLGPTVAKKVAEQLVKSKRPESSGLNLKQLLTEREREVLSLIGQGRNNKEIAHILSITEGTVKNHVSHIFAQIGARDRIQAALIAQHSL